MGIKLSSFRDSSQVSIENFGFKPIKSDEVTLSEDQLHEDGLLADVSEKNVAVSEKRKTQIVKTDDKHKRINRGIDHYFKDVDGENKNRSLSMDLKNVICPICSKTFAFNSLTCLNSHVDLCLKKRSSGILKYFQT